MKSKYFKDVENDTLIQLQVLSEKLKEESALENKKWIHENSPYTKDINTHIKFYEELYSYCLLQLKEAFVTRKALIKDIDLDLWVSAKGKTNKEIMLGGNPPYAFDAPNGVIELHHIGQSYDAPFAELTEEEHVLYGNSKVLHNSEHDSWRRDQAKVNAFAKERSDYWIKRAQNDIKIISTNEISPIPHRQFTDKKEKGMLIKEIVEQLLYECSIEDSIYISDLASSYALIKEFGADSFTDFIEQNQKDGDVIRCTYCGDSNYTLYGYTKGIEKIQRYRCKKCDKTFTAMNRSIISECNMSFMDWIKFVNCLYNGISEEKTALICNISKRSVHNYRLKVFYALKLLDDKVKLQGAVAIDETYLLDNFKGNRSEAKKANINRKSHKRGKENHSPGLSKKQVSVICALDEHGNSVARITGLGSATSARIDYALGDVFDNNTSNCIYSDKAVTLRKYAESKGIPIKQKKATIKGGKKYMEFNKEARSVQRRIQRVNSYHSRLKKFLSKFYGTSSRLLTGYICLFAWKERNKGRSQFEAYRELFSVMTQPNLYKSIEEIEAMECFSDVKNRKSNKTKTGFRDFERACEIYKRYAAGEKVPLIAKSYGMCRGGIYRIIAKFCELGYGYKTVMDVKAEESYKRRNIITYPYKTVDRNSLIYQEKMQWNGPINDFYKSAAEKYKLSVNSIKNIVSQEERIIALKKEFFMYGDFPYRTLQELYQSIYDRYLVLRKTFNVGQSIQRLTVEFNYKYVQIRRVITIMESGNKNEVMYAKKKKIPIGETLARDRAVFVDFLRWRGSKYNFCEWAKEKYKLSLFYIYQILRFNFIADPTKFEITYRKFKPHKAKTEA